MMNGMENMIKDWHDSDSNSFLQIEHHNSVSERKRFFQGHISDFSFFLFSFFIF